LVWRVILSSDFEVKLCPYLKNSASKETVYSISDCLNPRSSCLNWTGSEASHLGLRLSPQFHQDRTEKDCYFCFAFEIISPFKGSRVCLYDLCEGSFLTFSPVESSSDSLKSHFLKHRGCAERPLQLLRAFNFYYYSKHRTFDLPKTF